MFKLKKNSVRALGGILGIALFMPLSFGQEKTTTTTVEQSTTQVQTPAPVTRSKKAKARSSSSNEVLSTTTTTTTQVESAPMPLAPRKLYDEDTLRKISKTICIQGFRSYIGRDKNNLCLGKASPPDIAYSCVWDKKGTAVYPPSVQGPCNLDFTEHKGSVSVKGTEAQCCFRAAQGPALTAQ